MEKLQLHPGETLLWQGKPESFKTLDHTSTRRLLRDLMVCLLGGIFILAEIWLLSGMKSLPPILYTLVLLLMLVPVTYVLLDAHKLRTTEYVVTDRRLAVINKGVKEVNLSRIGEACVQTDADGHTSLLCGKKAITAPAASYRERTVLGLDALDGDDTPCESFAFYAVEHPDALKAALRNHLPLTESV